jgi:hypothetical protein
VATPVTTRTAAYRAALSGRCGRPDDTALAAMCASWAARAGLDPQAVWEGAVLAGVTAAQLAVVMTARNWAAVAALADLAGEMPGSAAVRYNRARWAARKPSPRQDATMTETDWIRVGHGFYRAANAHRSYADLIPPEIPPGYARWAVLYGRAGQPGSVAIGWLIPGRTARETDGAAGQVSCYLGTRPDVIGQQPVPVAHVGAIGGLEAAVAHVGAAHQTWLTTTATEPMTRPRGRARPWRIRGRDRTRPGRTR